MVFGSRNLSVKFLSSVICSGVCLCLLTSCKRTSDTTCILSLSYFLNAFHLQTAFLISSNPCFYIIFFSFWNLSFLVLNVSSSFGCMFCFKCDVSLLLCAQCGLFLSFFFPSFSLPSSLSFLYYLT